MYKVQVETDLAAVARQVKKAGRQLPFAMSLAMNRVTNEVRKELEAHINRDFDRPTPYTQRSLYSRYSTKRKLEAEVKLKDIPIGKSRYSSDQNLGHEFVSGAATGTTRNFTGLERWLYGKGYISSGEYVAPHANAKLDAYGNLSRGWLSRILSHLRINPDSTQWRSNSKRSVAKRTRAGTFFWSPGGNFSRGVWLRQAGKGKQPVKVISIIRRPRYSVRVDIKRIGDTVVERNWHRELRKAIDEALATAK